MTARTYGALRTKLGQEKNEEEVTDGNIVFQIWY